MPTRIKDSRYCATVCGVQGTGSSNLVEVKQVWVSSVPRCETFWETHVHLLEFHNGKKARVINIPNISYVEVLLLEESCGTKSMIL